MILLMFLSLVRKDSTYFSLSALNETFDNSYWSLLFSFIGFQILQKKCFIKMLSCITNEMCKPNVSWSIILFLLFITDEH